MFHQEDAHEAGVKFYCCSPNLDLFDMTAEDLIPECEGIVGGAKRSSKRRSWRMTTQGIDLLTRNQRVSARRSALWPIRR
ncbi:MAG: DsrE/DsrF/DrsH-like family protein [Nitratireductor sp.]